MSSKWALILGASSGFGAATSIELARCGYGIFGVHFDLRSTLPNAVRVQDEVKAAGQEAIFRARSRRQPCPIRLPVGMSWAAAGPDPARPTRSFCRW